MTGPLCKDCKHYNDRGAMNYSVGSNKRCTRNWKVTGINLVNGFKQRYYGPDLFCERERYPLIPFPWKCGTKGKFFKPRIEL